MPSPWSASGGRLTPWPGALPPDPTECFALTHIILTAKQSFVCTEIQIYCYENAQKLLPLELLLLAQIYTPNRLSAGALPQTHWESLHRSRRPPSWFRGGAHGEREGGRGGEKKEGEGRDGKEGDGVPEWMPKSRVGKPSYCVFFHKIWRQYKQIPLPVAFCTVAFCPVAFCPGLQ